MLAVVGGVFCGACASVPLRAGQTYGITWSCAANSCATELVTIAAVHHGWAVAVNGYVLKVDRPLWTRRAVQVPAIPRQSNGPVRADEDEPVLVVTC